MTLSALLAVTLARGAHGATLHSNPEASSEGGTSPATRSKGAMAIVQKVGYLDPERSVLLFGGCDPSSNAPYDDMWSMLLDDPEDHLQWVNLAKPAGEAWPTPRCGHTMQTVVSTVARVLMFGGRAKGGGVLRELWQYDFMARKHKWQLSAINASAAPPARSGHSSVASHKAMYIFGGWGGVDAMNDLWEFTMASSTWRNIVPASQRPTKRMGHIGALFGSSLFVYAGWDGTNCLGDIWRFDTVHSTWVSIQTDNSPAKPPPSARHGMLHVPIAGGMLVLGGMDVAARNLADVWVYTFPTNVTTTTSIKTSSTETGTATTLKKIVTTPRNNNSWVTVADVTGDTVLARSYASSVSWGLAGNETALYFGGVGASMDSLLEAQIGVLRLGQTPPTSLPAWPFYTFVPIFVCLVFGAQLHCRRSRRHIRLVRQWQVAYVQIRAKIETRKLLNKDDVTDVFADDLPSPAPSPRSRGLGSASGSGRGWGSMKSAADNEAWGDDGEQQPRPPSTGLSHPRRRGRLTRHDTIKIPTIPARTPSHQSSRSNKTDAVSIASSAEMQDSLRAKARLRQRP